MDTLNNTLGRPFEIYLLKGVGFSSQAQQNHFEDFR